MKLKQAVLAEMLTAVLILVVILVVVGGIPGLGSSEQNASVSMYQEKTYVKGNMTLEKGASASARFNYTTYDPAILVVDIDFNSWQSNGNLTLYCNGRAFASIIAAPDRPHVTINAISVSGADWIQPLSASWPTIGSFFAYGNELAFKSSLNDGYAGSFDYKIDIRGSR